LIDEIFITSLTPCFISGAANSNLKYDLIRVPSIKGNLRWWFRAIASPYLDLKNLKNIESILFGSTNNVSPFKIRTIPLNGNKNIKIIQNLVNSNLKFNYLWHPLFLKSNLGRNYIGVGTRFKIILNFNDIHLLKKYKKSLELFRKIWYHSFWFLFHLGGLGLKNRRGAGSFIIENVKIKNEDKTINLLKHNSVSISDFYEKEFNQIKRDINLLIKDCGLKVNKPDKSQLHSFTLSSENSKVFLISKFNSWINAAKKLQFLWQDFRRTIGRQDKCNLGYLGRPMRSKSKRGTYIIKDRFSSPFYFSIKKFNNSYYISNVLSETSFHKFNCSFIKGQEEREIIRSNNINIDLINNWIEFLEEKINTRNIININL